MTAVEQLEVVIEMEAQLAEALLEILEDQQQGVVHFNLDVLGRSVERAKECLEPLEALEKERMRLIGKVTGVPSEIDEGRTVAVLKKNDLLKNLEEKIAVRISPLLERLRMATEKVLMVEDRNRLLLEHSRRFIQETLRLIIEAQGKSLVDQKI